MGWVVTPQYIRSWSILAPWTFGIFFLSSWLWATWSADVQVKSFVPSFATEDGVKEHPQPVSIWISKIHQFGMIRLVRCSILWFLLAVYVNQSFVLTSDFAKVPAGLSQSLLESAFTGVCPALDLTAITASLIITAIHIYIRFAEFRCFPTATLDWGWSFELWFLLTFNCPHFIQDSSLRELDFAAGSYLSQPSVDWGDWWSCVNTTTRQSTLRGMSWNLKRWWRSSGLLMTSCQVTVTSPPQKHVFF